MLVNQSRQKAGHDRHTRGRQFVLDDTVYIRNFGNGPKWLPGVVTAVRGPLSYSVTLMDDRVVRRHIDHVQKRTNSSYAESDDWLPEPSMSSTSSPGIPHTLELRRSSRIRTAPERFNPCSS